MTRALLRPAAFGDVPADARKPDDRAFGIFDRREAKRDLQSPTILVDALGVEWLNVLAVPQPLVHGPEFIAAVRRHDDLERAAGHLMRRIAVHGAGGRVPTRDPE